MRYLPKKPASYLSLLFLLVIALPMVNGAYDFSQFRFGAEVDSSLRAHHLALYAYLFSIGYFWIRLTLNEEKDIQASFNLQQHIGFFLFKKSTAISLSQDDLSILSRRRLYWYAIIAIQICYQFVIEPWLSQNVVS